MSDIINILPDSVANQIAAGEVVDRPASAVKELLENAIDAGATQIQLIAKDAGRTLLQVIDNGCGMSENDARLCFERHATSKVKVADDLFNLHTMGFRGEALASIAAIAQVELKTRRHDSELGTCVVIEGSDIKSQTPEACAVGTSIAVKNLFYNVPARRNFLKRDSVELSHIEEVLRRVTLANCQCSFTFYHNGKLLYDLRAGNLAQRICQLFGENYRERLYAVDEETDLLTIHGYVGKPEFAKKTRGEQYLFVNNRFIKHPALSAAIEKAYADLMPDRYYPSYFVNLKVNPARLDVNIHPTKTEVKFMDEQTLFSLLRAAVKKSIGQFTLATQLEFDPSTEIDFTPAPQGYVPKQPKVSFNPDYNPFDPPSSGGAKASAFSGGWSHGGDKDEKGASPTASRWDNFFGDEELNQTSSDGVIAEEAAAQEATMPMPIGHTCFQVQNRWIAGAMASGLLLIEQQRAHERILFERLMNAQSSAGAQQMLFPVSCSFSPADAELFAELLPDLRQRGFQIDNLGKCTFVVSATPPDVPERSLQSLFEQMLADYKGSMLQRFGERDKTLCLSLARQMAIRRGQALQNDEMQRLVADLFSCNMPEISPSGQRVMVILSSDQLAHLIDNK